MFKLGRLFAFSFLLGLTAWAGKLITPGPDDVLTPDEVVVRLKPNGTISTVLAGFNNTVTVSAAQSTLNLYLLKVPSAVRDVILQQLAALNEVEYAEPNRIRAASALTPNDTSYATQWWLTKMQASEAWGLYPGRFPVAGQFGSRVRVAILDTGANCTHPEFINPGGSTTDLGGGGQFNWALSQALVPTTAVGAACPWQDDHGHGTHVAGTLASVTNNALGVASLGYTAELVIYKILDSQGNGDDFTISQAITAATDAGARVISMSLGGNGYSQSLQDAVNYAWNHDVVVVAASGNANTSALTYPGNANYAVGVGATDSSDARANFSNYGFGLDVMAPGVSIYSTYLNSGYATMSGTSMATPSVSALASMIIASTPNLSADAVIQRIEMSADTTMANGLWDVFLGFGRVNAYRALSGNLPVKNGGGLVGQIVDPAGNSIANAAVGMGGLNGNTDANGLFRFANLPPGTYTFTSSSPGYATRSQSVVIPPGADTHVRLELGTSTGVFTGTIRDGAAALPNVVVQALSGGLVRQATITDANGLYTLTVTAGTYDLRGSAVGRSTRVSSGVTVAAGATTTVDFNLPAMGSIGGVITNSAAALVSGAQVTAYNSTDSGGATSAADGTYRTLSLPAGTYTVVVSAPNNQPATIPNVVVNEGQVTDLDVQLPSSAVLTTLTLSPASLGGGASSTANTVTLSAPAGPGGAVVTLASNKPAVALPPATVTVPAGAKVSNPFTITTTAVTSNTLATISATLGGVTKSVNLSVVPYSIYAVYLSPASTGGGATTTGNRVQLNALAPTGGAIVSLASDTPGVTVPATVTVAAGSSVSAYFSITTSAVTVSTPVQITATYAGASKSSTLTVNPTSLASFTVSPATIAGGKPLSSAVVKLDSPAPAGGAVVQLTSSDSAVQLPSQVSIAAGASASASIPVTTSIVSASVLVTLTATYNGASKAATVTVTPPAVSSIILPATIAGGKAITSAYVVMSGPAPAGGLAVGLSSSNPALAPPATITIPAGATSSGYFTIPTNPVSAPISVIVTATAGGVSKTATIQVKPPALSGFTASPATISGGKAITNALLTLDGPAGPSGAVVTISSSDASMSPPATFTIPAGASSSGYFTIPTNAVSAATPVTLTASFGGVSKSLAFTVKPPSLLTFTASPLTIVGGKPITVASLTLDGPAGAAGATVTLVSNNPSIVPPATVTIPAGATVSANFVMNTSAVSASVQVTVTASYGGVSKVVTFTVKPPALQAFTVSPPIVSGGKPFTSAYLTLDGPAGPAGAAVTLVSSDPSISPPATFTIPAGATVSGSFSLPTSAVSSNVSVTLTASFGGVSKNVTVTVKPTAILSLTISPLTVSGGKPFSAALVTLDGPAPPGGANVTLVSSDSAAVPSPVVTIPAGATNSGYFSIPTNFVASSRPVTITASYGGVSKTASVTVKPTDLSSFTVSPATVKGGGKIFLGAGLDGPAIPGGAAVVLQSADPAVPLPASLVVPAGTTYGTLAVTTGAVSASTTVTLTASYGAVTKTVTVTLTP
ncbi:MAG: carboxypeptidase regulatory-like domain-containing protein [Acidobacteria bacterium]|nr:carboxypeptidase regulatory-like domain-containing protein [Acidobacteriota bacterium]